MKPRTATSLSVTRTVRMYCTFNFPIVRLMTSTPYCLSTSNHSHRRSYDPFLAAHVENLLFCSVNLLFLLVYFYSLPSVI
jgi:hypothetical protein